MAEFIGRNGSEQRIKSESWTVPDRSRDRTVFRSLTIYPGQSRLHNIHDNVAFSPIRACSKRLLIGQLLHLLSDHNPQMIMRPEGPSAFERTVREANFANYPKCEFLSILDTLSCCDYQAEITC